MQSLPSFDHPEPKASAGRMRSSGCLIDGRRGIPKQWVGAAAQELALVVAVAAQVVALVGLMPVGADGRDPRASARLLLLTVAHGMRDLHYFHSGVAPNSKGPHKMSKTVSTSTDCRSRWTAPDTQDQ